ncbi:hypothetical protein CSUB01_12293 [Colletotrichum sublineola]|uniref:Uncharacterized protein n=1 Tax=Colletotrichum sublineola TaxID=1173701 RepID=A0A066XLY3_COLSU|nr:hypothetical protein CSUB01_12293 [Colletotrichum sublineola]
MDLRISPVNVFAVREDQEGRDHKFIDQAFKFSSVYLSRQTVCFRLAATIKDGDYNDFLIYLQITPDCLNSLHFKPFDFDTVPRDQGSPPQYGECVSEGKKPRTISDDAANLVENSRVDYALPKYSETNELRTPTFVSKRLRPYRSEDVLSTNPKRLLSRGLFTAISVTAVTRNARRLKAKSRPELDDADINNRVLLRNLMRQVAQQEEQIKHLRQGQQSKQLQQEKIIKQLQDNVKKLRQHTEGGYRELEGICDNLACRQDRAEEDLENLDVHTSELYEICDKLEEQIPNVSDQMGDVLEEYMGDWVKEHLSDWVKEHMEKLVSKHMGKGGEGDLAGLLREYVRENVTTQVAEIKAKMLKALEG